MTEMFVRVAADAPCECQSCDWKGRGDQVDAVSDLEERVEAGEVMPAGECPKCGALVALTKAPPSRTYILIAVKRTGGIGQQAGYAARTLDNNPLTERPDTMRQVYAGPPGPDGQPRALARALADKIAARSDAPAGEVVYLGFGMGEYVYGWR